LEMPFKDDISLNGIRMDISKIIEVSDGLQVLLELDYDIGNDRMYYWYMAEPSKNIQLSITYPNSKNCDYFIGGLNSNDYLVENDKVNHNFLFLRRGWMLPRSGLAFSFSNKVKNI
jgi:hypothetical protein